MTYATQQQLIDRFGAQTLLQLTDRADPPLGAIDAVQVGRALTDTDAVINGYVGVRYRLPLDPVPELVTDLALSIAIYKLHVFAPDPKVKDDYDQALRTLRDISSGTVRLDAAGIASPSSGAEGVQFTDRERPLSPESMTGFI
jgi:phage gp36-like protein